MRVDVSQLNRLPVNKYQGVEILVNGILVSRGKSFLFCVTAVAALLTAGCFNIILGEPPPLLEEPLTSNEDMTVIPSRGDFGPPSEPGPSNQETQSGNAVVLDPAADNMVSTGDPGPTVTLPSAPLPTFQLSVNGVPATDPVLALEGGEVEFSLPPREPSGLYRDGDRVDITAIPEEGYEFGAWGGDCSGDGDVCILTIDGNKDLSAGFVPLGGFFYGLDLVVYPVDGGEVQVQPPPIAPEGKYIAGTKLELSAINSDGYEFTGWDGACEGTDQKCRIILNADKSVKASFDREFYTLTIDRVLVDRAGVSVSHGQVSVFPFVYSPKQDFARSAIVSLTVDPNAGFVVVEWGGDCSGLAPDTTECRISMDRDKLVEVKFAVDDIDIKS